MKRIMTAIAAAALSAVCAAGPISGTLTLTGMEFANAPTGTMTVDPPGWLNLNAQSTTSLVGAVTGVFDDGFFPQSILAYCIELFAPTGNFGQSLAYTQNQNPHLAAFGQAFSATQQSLLDKQFVKQFVNFGGVNADATASAAMQLAIWEIVYDGGNAGDLSAGLFGLGAGEFYSSSVNGARTVAESLLAGLGSYDTTGFTVSYASYNNGGSKAGYQDLLTAQVTPGSSCPLGNPECDPNTVPEPDSLALIGASLFGLGLVTRRRQAKKDAEREAQLIA